MYCLGCVCKWSAYAEQQGGDSPKGNLVRTWAQDGRHGRLPAPSVCHFSTFAEFAQVHKWYLFTKLYITGLCHF